MSLDNVYSNDNVPVNWDPDNKWVYLDWQGKVSKEGAITGCEEGLKLLNNEGC